MSKFNEMAVNGSPKMAMPTHTAVTGSIAQTFTDFELLLVDDGSPDRCGEICDEYAGKDKRVRVFHQENAGLSCARNKGLEHASGICWRMTKMS